MLCKKIKKGKAYYNPLNLSYSTSLNRKSTLKKPKNNLFRDVKKELCLNIPCCSKGSTFRFLAQTQVLSTIGQT